MHKDRKSELLYRLEKSLEQGDISFLLIDEQRDILSFLSQYYKSQIYESSKKRIVSIVTDEIEVNNDSLYYQISKSEADELRKLYYMYEFSDKFHIIAAENNYGDIFNFFKTGILTMREIVEVFYNV